MPSFRIFLEALEDRIASVIKMYKLPPDEAKQRATMLAQFDPTTNKEYLAWLVKQDVNKIARFPEDGQRAFNALKVFHEAKKRRGYLAGMGLSPNIDTYTLHQLEDVEDKLRGPSKRQEEVKAKKEGGKVVLDDGYYTVIQITSPEAACYYARNTKWCTSRLDYAEQYLKDGPLYIVFAESKQLMQFHPASMQFMDVRDRPFDFSKNTPLKEIVEKFIDDKDPDQWWQWKEMNNEPLEIQDAINAAEYLDKHLGTKVKTNIQTDIKWHVGEIIDIAVDNREPSKVIEDMLLKLLVTPIVGYDMMDKWRAVRKYLRAMKSSNFGDLVEETLRKRALDDKKAYSLHTFFIWIMYLDEFGNVKDHIDEIAKEVVANPAVLRWLYMKDFGWTGSRDAGWVSAGRSAEPEAVRSPIFEDVVLKMLETGKGYKMALRSAIEYAGKTMFGTKTDMKESIFWQKVLPHIEKWMTDDHIYQDLKKNLPTDDPLLHRAQMAHWFQPRDSSGWLKRQIPDEKR